MNPSELGGLICACTQDVFTTMLRMEISSEDGGKNGSPLLRAEATALIGLAGELQGSLSLHCTQDQARAFAARLLGRESKELEDQGLILDAIGEIANMIAGNLKRDLPGPKGFELSLPLAAFLRRFHIRAKGGSSLIVAFSSPVGPFCVELILS